MAAIFSQLMDPYMQFLSKTSLVSDPLAPQQKLLQLLPLPLLPPLRNGSHRSTLALPQIALWLTHWSMWLKKLPISTHSSSLISSPSLLLRPL